MMALSLLASLLLSVFCAGFSRGQAPQESDHCHGIFYEDFGCFSRVHPFNNTPELPQAPHFIDTTFYLFTRHNRHIAQILRTRDMGGAQLNASRLDASLPVKILVHGFLQNDRSPWVLETTRVLLEEDDVNVITMDWGRGAGFPYTQAAANTRVAGAEVARLVTLLGAQRGVAARDVHLIGHSLGAHVAAHAGSRLRGSLGRITGLDPADPSFSYKPPAVRLDSSDARWVDVIHTDGGPYTTYGGYGTLQPMGHVDFYPNGGRDQPGCHSDTSAYSFVREAYREGMDNAESAMACSHDRSTLLFIQSISSASCPFTAYPCASSQDFAAGRCLRCGNRPCPTMGYGADLYKRTGAFYLHTLPHTPFCGYHYLVNVSLDETMDAVTGELHVQISGDEGHTAPLRLHSGEMTPGGHVSAVVLATENVGHVGSVTLTYTPASNYFSWMLSSGVVHVRGVLVEQVNRQHILHFCPRSAALEAGRPVALHDGTRDPRPCFQP